MLLSSPETSAENLAMFVVDASVWVSSFLNSDVNHDLAARWVDRAVEREVTIYAPPVLLAEVAGSVARVTDNPFAGIERANHLLDTQNLQIVVQDTQSYLAAARLASQLRLRGCDALYVQVAAEQDSILVSLDEQQIQRSGSVVASARLQDVPIP